MIDWRRDKTAPGRQIQKQRNNDVVSASLHFTRLGSAAVKLSHKIFNFLQFLDHKLISYRYSSCCCWEDLFKKLWLRRIKSVRDEIWQDCSSSKIHIKWLKRNNFNTKWSKQSK